MTDSQLIPSVMAKLLFVCVASVLLAASYGMSLLGGPKPLDVNDKNVKDAVVFAVNQHNFASNDMYVSRPVKVINATRQLVSGVLYDVFVEVGRTTCRKPTADFTECAFHAAPSLAKTETCHFSVLMRSWESLINLQKAECE